MRNLTRTLLILLTLTSPVLAQHSAADSDGPPAGVSWYAGDLTQALGAAQQQHRPVFVYFGAAWCPPCLDLKSTVFKRKDFLNRLQLFVPLYIDGDAPDAQRRMQQLHVLAYPTVLILSSDGSEIDRVAGGMNLDRYASVLDTGLKAARPLKDILISLQDDGTASLTLDDCRILAYNNWNIEEAWIFARENTQWVDQTADQLQRAAERCPPQGRLERARLQMFAAYAAAIADADNMKKGSPVKPRLKPMIDHVRAVIGDPKLTPELGDVFVYMPAKFRSAIDKLEPEHAAAFREQLTQLMNSLQTDTRYAMPVRLYATDQIVVLSKGEDGKGTVPPQIAEQARKKVEAAIAGAPTSRGRAGIMNGALDVLDDLGDKERQRAVLQHEIQISPTPYFYMSELAELEEDSGNKQAALEWFGRAYRESMGRATRVQWGSYYIKGLIRLKPEDERTISETLIEVLGQARDQDLLYGRSREEMESVAGKIHEWNAADKHATAVARIHQTLDPTCNGSSLSADSRAACKAVLSRI